MKKVGALVVTFNRLNLLKEAIDSLRSQTFKDIQIIVVNNGSTDGTKEWLNTQEDVYTITQENLGGAGGFFTGMKYIAETGYEYCWLMDDDVVCNSTALSELLKALQSDENIGFVCSKVIGINGDPMNVPSVDIRSTKNGYPYWYDRIDDYMIRIKSATFVSILLLTKRIFEFGLPYKEFFLWGDDFEYTMRISEPYISYMVCKSEVIHKREIQEKLSFETEINHNRLKNYFYMFRNHLFIYRKHGSHKQYAKGIVWQCLFILKLIAKKQIYKAKIIFKSTIASVSFNPIVEYPSNIPHEVNQNLRN